MSDDPAWSRGTQLDSAADACILFLVVQNADPATQNGGQNPSATFDTAFVTSTYRRPLPEMQQRMPLPYCP